MADQEKLLTVLQELIAIDSINPTFGGTVGEAKVADYLEAYFAPYSPKVEFQQVFEGRNNILFHFDGDREGPPLVFEAHMDTVSIADTARSTLKPFIEEGRVYGRGACDTKGSMAAMIVAISTLIDERGSLPLPVTFIGSVDEEYRAKGVYDLVERGIEAAGAVVGEPTGLDIIIAHKGVYRFSLECIGKSVHSSKPLEGINAVYKMMDVITAMQRELEPTYLKKEHYLTGGPTLNVGVIKGGNEVNTVPALCTIEVDRRVCPGEQRPDVEREFDQILETLKATDPHFEGRIYDRFYDPPLDTSEDSEIVQAMLLSCKEANRSAAIVGVPYGSDASKLAMAGIPSVVFGPGDIANAHTDHEYVLIEELVMAMEVYRNLMLQFGKHQ